MRSLSTTLLRSAALCCLALCCLALGLLPLGCSSGTDEPAPTPPPPDAGTVESFADVGGPNEGIAFGQNAQQQTVLYVSRLNVGLVAIDPQGKVGDFSSVPKPVGIAVRADGKLLVCGKADDSSTESVIWLVSPDGSKSVLVSGDSAPFGLTNFVAVAPDDRVVLTDSDKEVVYAADSDGSGLEVVSSTIPYPNGLAFSADGATLFVASWSSASIYAVPRNAADGSYGEPTKLTDGVPNVDGLVAMANGDLLAITNGKGVLRIDVSGDKTEIAPGTAFSLAANGAFGVGAFDSKWLYVSNFIGPGVTRVRFEDEGVSLPVR